MAALQGLVATQVKVIQLNFSCQFPVEFQSAVTVPQQQTDEEMELMTFGMSFEKAVQKQDKEVREEKSNPPSSFIKYLCFFIRDLYNVAPVS